MLKNNGKDGYFFIFMGKMVIFRFMGKMVCQNKATLNIPNFPVRHMGHLLSKKTNLVNLFENLN